MNLESYILCELRMYMEREGITVISLAQSCDFPKKEVQGYLNGEYRMPLDFIIVACHVMGSSVDEMERCYQKLPHVLATRIILS